SPRVSFIENPATSLEGACQHGRTLVRVDDSRALLALKRLDECTMALGDDEDRGVAVGAGPIALCEQKAHHLTTARRSENVEAYVEGHSAPQRRLLPQPPRESVREPRAERGEAIADLESRARARRAQQERRA